MTFCQKAHVSHSGKRKSTSSCICYAFMSRLIMWLYSHSVIRRLKKAVNRTEKHLKNTNILYEHIQYINVWIQWVQTLKNRTFFKNISDSAKKIVLVFISRFSFVNLYIFIFIISIVHLFYGSVIYWIKHCKNPWNVCLTSFQLWI